MTVTINVNGLSLVHKASMGVVTATLPDVCKTPSPGGPVPIPYPNIAFSKDLSKGSTTVKADGGNSCAIKGSEFSTSVGDEPGTAGGVKSSVNKGKATWISWSFDVRIDGKNACRLTDKMLMNKENTASLGGLCQPPLSPDEIMDILCAILCECEALGRGQDCVREKIEADNYMGRYPNENAQIWREVSMRQQDGVWQIIMNNGGAGSVPTSNPITPRNGIRPDCVGTDGHGQPTRIFEMKLGNDTLNANQRPGGNYSGAARDLGVDYEVLDSGSDSCNCGGGAPAAEPAPANAPAEDEGWSTGEVALAAGAVVLGVLAVAAIVGTGGAAAAALAAVAGGTAAAT